MSHPKGFSQEILLLSLFLLVGRTFGITCVNFRYHALLVFCVESLAAQDSCQFEYDVFLVF